MGDGKILLHNNCKETFGILDWKINRFQYQKKPIRKYSTVARVEPLPLVKTLINFCLNRDSVWGNEMHTLLLSCNDVAAEEAFCHCCKAPQILWHNLVCRSLSKICFSISSDKVKLFN